jgi:hypothetical protein
MLSIYSKLCCLVLEFGQTSSDLTLREKDSPSPRSHLSCGETWYPPPLSILRVVWLVFAATLTPSDLLLHAQTTQSAAVLTEDSFCIR